MVKRTVDAAPAGKLSALIDTRVIYCGDRLDRLHKLPNGGVDLIYIDAPLRPLEGISGPMEVPHVATDDRYCR